MGELILSYEAFQKILDFALFLQNILPYDLPTFLFLTVVLILLLILLVASTETCKLNHLVHTVLI